eukprot:5232481-Amphidinium_carterae.1
MALIEQTHCRVASERPPCTMVCGCIFDLTMLGGLILWPRFPWSHTSFPGMNALHAASVLGQVVLKPAFVFPSLAIH